MNTAAATDTARVADSKTRNMVEELVKKGNWKVEGRSDRWGPFQPTGILFYSYLRAKKQKTNRHFIPVAIFILIYMMFNDLKNDCFTRFCTLVFCFVLPCLFSQWIRDSFSLTVVSLCVIIFKDILYTDSPIIFLLENNIRASNVFSVFHTPLPHAALHILSVISPEKSKV